MINVVSFSDKAFEADWVSVIDQAFSDTLKLLTHLPDTLDIAFTEEGAEQSTGVGGFSVSPHRINIALMKDFHDIALQKSNLRGVIFHELFHVNQGFTCAQSPFTALDAAVYEGCAVVFEREYGGGVAIYADYHQHTDEELSGWLEQLRNVGTQYFEDHDTWQKWAFYHPELDQKWIIYKVGAWLIERILAQHNLSILDLADKKPAEIMSLAAPLLQSTVTK
jgi:hypothetical protein